MSLNVYLTKNDFFNHKHSLFVQMLFIATPIVFCMFFAPSLYFTVCRISYIDYLFALPDKTSNAHYEHHTHIARQMPPKRRRCPGKNSMIHKRFGSGSSSSSSSFTSMVPPLPPVKLSHTDIDKAVSAIVHSDDSEVLELWRVVFDSLYLRVPPVDLIRLIFQMGKPVYPMGRIIKKLAPARGFCVTDGYRVYPSDAHMLYRSSSPSSPNLIYELPFDRTWYSCPVKSAPTAKGLLSCFNSEDIYHWDRDTGRQTKWMSSDFYAPVQQLNFHDLTQTLFLTLYISVGYWVRAHDAASEPRPVKWTLSGFVACDPLRDRCVIITESLVSVKRCSDGGEITTWSIAAKEIENVSATTDGYYVVIVHGKRISVFTWEGKQIHSSPMIDLSGAPVRTTGLSSGTHDGANWFFQYVDNPRTIIVVE